MRVPRVYISKAGEVRFNRAAMNCFGVPSPRSMLSFYDKELRRFRFREASKNDIRAFRVSGKASAPGCGFFRATLLPMTVGIDRSVSMTAEYDDVFGVLECSLP